MNDDIFERFPDMQPISSPPSLFGIYGIGTSIAGKRDVDEQTVTYVKTHCLTLLFIPLIAIGAYRVADAQTEGWYRAMRTNSSNSQTKRTRSHHQTGHALRKTSHCSCALTLRSNASHRSLPRWRKNTVVRWQAISSAPGSAPTLALLGLLHGRPGAV